MWVFGLAVKTAPSHTEMRQAQLFPTPVPANVHSETAGDSFISWEPATHVGNSNCVPDS